MKTTFEKQATATLSQPVRSGEGRVVQPKLAINQPGDRYEKEANQVADTVMQMKEGDMPVSHRLALTNAQLSTSPTNVVYRHEMPDETPNNQLLQGDWKRMDRLHDLPRWKYANLFNLNRGASREYQEPHERRDFYLWFYNISSDFGYETRWPLAAYLVAGGASQLTFGPVVFDDDVQVLVRRANQIIFDAAFLKLQSLWQGGPLRGDAALAWDAQTLSDEQALVQTMYASAQPAVVDEFGTYARQEGVQATVGSWLGLTRPQPTVDSWLGLAGPRRSRNYHRQDPMPAFSGDIRSIDDRFRYGMSLADQFSTHPRSPRSFSRPAAGAAYASGSQFRQLDTMRGMHRLEAELDNADVNESAIILIMRGLSQEEQAQLGWNRQRLDFIKAALNRTEISLALSSMLYVLPSVRHYLLN